MKKIARTLTALGMILVLLLTLTACGSAKKETATASNVNGKTYAFESYTLDGEDATESITGTYASQTFAFKDGTCEQTIVWAEALASVMGTDPVVVSGTYVEDGNTVTVTFKVDGEEDTVMAFTIDGDTLQLAEEGSTTVYRAVSES